MNGFRDMSRRPAGAKHPEDGEIERDLSALASATSRDLPNVHETVRRARDRAPVRAGGFPMAAVRFLWLRPMLSTVTAVALGLFVVFGLPIPFERTVGHDVTLTVSGPDLGTDRARTIVSEMKTLLGAESVRVEAEASSGDGMSYRFFASLAERSGAKARSAAQALAASVKAAGYEATADVLPRTERVSGTVYAFAADRVIRISTDGKSAPQLEAEIRDRLLAAGLRDVQVSVSDEGEQQKVGIEVHRESAGEPVEDMPEVVLTKNGQDIAGAGAGQCQVRVKRLKDEAGATKLVLDLTKDGRATTVEVPNVDGMSDLTLRSELQAQLDRAGIQVRVEVRDGQISVDSDR